jgi:hypothetical protein
MASIICAMKIATLGTTRIMYKVLITSASTAGSQRAPLCTVKTHRGRTVLFVGGLRILGNRRPDWTY